MVDYNNWLKPLSSKIKLKNNYYGFDIETSNKNKNFLMGSLVSDNLKKVFYDKEDMKSYLSTMPKSILIATNLEFDSKALFCHKNSLYPYKPFFRNSDMISGEFENIKFVDTMNYLKMSVENLGKFLNIPKMKKPDFLGNAPKNDAEWEYLKNYNIQDSFISYSFYKYLSSASYNQGCKLKITIASTSMDLFRRKFLNNYYRRTSKLNNILQKNAYFGGRTEAFFRGIIENYNYYDFNSLYPSVMVNDMPNPNYCNFIRYGKMKYINEYDGISNVKIKAPDMFYPFLPFRNNEKLLFCIGEFEGFYTNIELRKAIELGYQIESIKEQFYYSKNVFIFKDFVKELYKLRMQYKRQNNEMELFIKLMLNSLYGKFGMKLESTEIKNERDININEINQMINDGKKIDVLGDYYIFKKELKENKIPAYAIPIFSIYITAMARIKLYDELVSAKGIYCDTDSIISKKELDTSNKLGKLKKEYKIRNGMIIKPKMYYFDEHIKLKGFRHIDMNKFNAVIENKKISYMKFMKFKETLRRKELIDNETPYFNQPVLLEKGFNLEDNKRIWKNKFSPYEYQKSEPIRI